MMLSDVSRHFTTALAVHLADCRLELLDVPPPPPPPPRAHKARLCFVKYNDPKADASCTASTNVIIRLPVPGGVRVLFNTA